MGDGPAQPPPLQPPPPRARRLILAGMVLAALSFWAARDPSRDKQDHSDGGIGRSVTTQRHPMVDRDGGLAAVVPYDVRGQAAGTGWVIVASQSGSIPASPYGHAAAGITITVAKRDDRPMTAADRSSADRELLERRVSKAFRLDQGGTSPHVIIGAPVRDRTMGVIGAALAVWAGVLVAIGLASRLRWPWSKEDPVRPAVGFVDGLLGAMAIVWLFASMASPRREDWNDPVSSVLGFEVLLSAMASGELAVVRVGEEVLPGFASPGPVSHTLQYEHRTSVVEYPMLAPMVHRRMDRLSILTGASTVPPEEIDATLDRMWSLPMVENAATRAFIKAGPHEQSEIIWSGVVANLNRGAAAIAVIAAAMPLVVMVSQLRKRAITDLNRCMNCDYPLVGKDRSGPCPECGLVRGDDL